MQRELLNLGVLLAVDLVKDLVRIAHAALGYELSAFLLRPLRTFHDLRVHGEHDWLVRDGAADSVSMLVATDNT